MHVLKLPIIMNMAEHRTADKRFRILNRGHNAVVKHAMKLLKQLSCNKEYQSLHDDYSARKKQLLAADKDADASKDPMLKDCTSRMNKIREGVGLTKTGLEKYGKAYQHRMSMHISSQQMQKECDRVWQGVEKVLFGNGKHLHFRKLTDCHTISTKSDNGCKFYFVRNDVKHTYEPYIDWLGMELMLKLDLTEKDHRLPERNYAYEALFFSRLKYVEISREAFPAGWRYYANLYLEGYAPCRLTPGTSTTGIDYGTSTVASASETMVTLEELAPDCSKYNHQIADLQRSIDRSMRASNPGNYNPDGTIRKGKKTWVFTKTCRKKKRLVQTLCRKKSAETLRSHNEYANRLVEDSCAFIAEPMNMSALAKRSAKKAERSEMESTVTKKDGSTQTIHKFKRKKRFGKSVTDRSPALLGTRLKMKADQYHLPYLEIDPWTYRASQYDHALDTYIKVPLSKRMKNVGGHKVQRDEYSAYLCHCASADLSAPDRQICEAEFANFCRMQDELIADMKARGKSRPACFGF